MKTIDYRKVMSWNPCRDFPPERLEKMFSGHEEYTLDDVLDLDIRQDERLWVALREAFFTPEELETLAFLFAMHASSESRHDDQEVVQALVNASLACVGAFDALPDDRRHERWSEGATDAERSAALAALWSAIARAKAAGNGDRMMEWNQERDWQIELVRERANADTSAN